MTRTPLQLGCRWLLMAFIVVRPTIAFAQSYPITLQSSLAFDSLHIAYQRLSITFGSGSLSLIECEKGVTGATVLAEGTFTFRTDDSQPIQDRFTGAMLRFNPTDYNTFFNPSNARNNERPEADKGCQDILDRTFKYLYHEGKEAILPKPGVLAGAFLGTNLGTFLALDGGSEKPLAWIIHKFANETL